jgi:tetratricopeptide (TPR) repeat protein
MNIGMDESSTNKIRQLAAAYAQEKISWNEAHYQLADDYVAQKQYGRAEKEYRAVLKIIPENYHAYFKMGELYLTQERFPEAEAWLHQALQRHPRSPFVFAKLATVHFSSQSYEKAIAYFDTALALNKMSGEFGAAETGWAEYYKAVSHLQLGQKAESMKALTEVVRLQPANAQAKQLLALLQSNAAIRLQLKP